MNHQQITNLVLNSWSATIKKVDAIFEDLTEEELLNEIAPNRNRGIYIIGHLVAANDLLLSLLTVQNSMFPELKNHFFKNPDSPGKRPFTAEQLQQYWTTINTELQKHFNHFSPEDWTKKHNAVSDEDFIKEPHRNKLNVIIGRTNHMNYHLGQLNLLKTKN